MIIMTTDTNLCTKSVGWRYRGQRFRSPVFVPKCSPEMDLIGVETANTPQKKYPKKQRYFTSIRIPYMYILYKSTFRVMMQPDPSDDTIGITELDDLVIELVHSQSPISIMFVHVQLKNWSIFQVFQKSFKHLNNFGEKYCTHEAQTMVGSVMRLPLELSSNPFPGQDHKSISGVSACIRICSGT